jgi:hypothetical protein
VKRNDLLYFHAFGFVVLKSAFDPGPLAREVDDTLRDTPGSQLSAPVGDVAIRFRYAPMMTVRTPASLALLDRLDAVAAELLGGPVLPTRAKAVRYVGDSPWHADSTHAVPSLGCAAYLEPLRAENGALRVLPGSHHPSFADALRQVNVAGLTAAAFPGHVLETEPGDVIVFDEHLWHASAGGGARRQWRIDYIREPDDDASAAIVRSYFGGIFAPDWEGGYDADRHPSYGPDWLTSGRRAVAELAKLGVYALAEAHEARGRR